ncbi:MAG: MogA/MoaB family molybdenum cofactor biosynthesis protein [Thermomicrobiales bacterium]
MTADTSISASVEEHRAAAPIFVRCAVLTVSDTRTDETDRSGGLIKELLERHGHVVVDYRIVPDEAALIQAQLREWSATQKVDVILTNGGTGIARRDTTYDVVVSMIEQRLDGFGELFRALSFQEIGAAAMLSRAVAGVIAGTFVVAMPGSTNAVKLAMEQLVLPEISHVVFELKK